MFIFIVLVLVSNHIKSGIYIGIMSALQRWKSNISVKYNRLFSRH